MKKTHIALFVIVVCAFLFSSCGKQLIDSIGTGQLIESSEVWRIPNTATTVTEAPELQEKINRPNSYAWYVPSKVIIECGELRDVPFLVGAEARVYIDEWETWNFYDGYNMFGFGLYRPSEDEKDYPVIMASGDQAIRFYVNDCDYRTEVILVDGDNHEIATFSTAEEVVRELGQGRYYAYAQIRCDGDWIIEGGRKTREYAAYRAYFILELV